MSDFGTTAPGPQGTGPQDPPSGWHVGRVLGVPVFVAPSALLFAVVLTVLYAPLVRSLLPDAGSAALVAALAVPALVAASVFAHELGHLLAGKAVGIAAKRITLDILGGETQFERDAPTAGREAAVAASGPAVSVALAAIGYVAQATLDLHGFTGLLVWQFWLVNLLLAAFNLLPGLPLDGGWILRAVMWKVTGRAVTSVRIAAWIGRLLALALVADQALRLANGGFTGLLVPVTVAMVAYQIWSGASTALREFPRTRPGEPLAGPPPQGPSPRGGGPADQAV